MLKDKLTKLLEERCREIVDSFDELSESSQHEIIEENTYMGCILNCLKNYDIIHQLPVKYTLDALKDFYGYEYETATLSNTPLINAPKYDIRTRTTPDGTLLDELGYWYYFLSNALETIELLLDRATYRNTIRYFKYAFTVLKIKPNSFGHVVKLLYIAAEHVKERKNDDIHLRRLIKEVTDDLTGVNKSNYNDDYEYSDQAVRGSGDALHGDENR